jgi:hypothetical protein
MQKLPFLPQICYNNGSIVYCFGLGNLVIIDDYLLQKKQAKNFQLASSKTNYYNSFLLKYGKQ